MFFGSVEKPPRLSEFELPVPEKLIAQDPLKKRDDCKLMVLNRKDQTIEHRKYKDCLLYTSPSPRDGLLSRMPSSA